MAKQKSQRSKNPEIATQRGQLPEQSGRIDEGKTLSVTMTQQSMSFTGPLPPPHILGMYNEILPGMAERLVASFESQQAHRHQLECDTIAHGIKRSWYGLWCGFAIAIGGLCVSATAVICGQQIAASIIGGGTLVGLVSVFVTGQQVQKRERENRRDALVNK